MRKAKVKGKSSLPELKGVEIVSRDGTFILYMVARAVANPLVLQGKHRRPTQMGIGFKMEFSTLHFWGRTSTYHLGERTGCINCGSLHPYVTPGSHFIGYCVNCMGQASNDTWLERNSLGNTAEEMNRFISFLSPEEFKFVLDAARQVWIADIQNS